MSEKLIKEIKQKKPTLQQLKIIFILDSKLILL